MKRIWVIEYAFEKDDTIWNRYRLVAENFGAALKRAQEKLQEDHEEEASKFRLTKIEEGEEIDE